MLTSLFAAVALAGCVAKGEPAFDTLIAHRGESYDAPENTLPAFQTAVDRGFGFECDLYLSTDKRIFSFHDRNLKRTTGKDLKCSDASWADTVSKLDAGEWKGARWKGVRPALLEEILPLARKGRKIYLEIKSGPEIVPYVKEVLAKQSVATPETVLFICVNEAVCRALDEQLPDYKVYLLSRAALSPGSGQPPRPRTAEDVVAALRRTGADGVDIFFDPEVVTESFVKAINAAGYEVHVWTIDDLDTALQAFQRGAKTVTTNRAKSLYDGYRKRKRLVAQQAANGVSDISDTYLAAARKAYARPEYASYTNSVVGDYPVPKGMRGDINVDGRVRWFHVEGASNFRDIGIWNGLRAGRVIRGSATESTRDPKLDISEQGRETLVRQLGIRTDLDLRGAQESRLDGKSNLGDGVAYVRIPVSAYEKIFTPSHMPAFAKALRVFADRANYPVYVHCYGGADRTGTLMFLLEGLCGVNEIDLSIDYELTTFAGPPRPRRSQYAKMVRGMKERPGATLPEKIAWFVEHELGLSRIEIDAIRAQLVPAEWEDHTKLSLNKLPPRAWFGSFPSVEEARAIRPERSPRYLSLDSEEDWRFCWTRRPADRPKDFYRTDFDDSAWDVVKVPCSWQAMGIRKSGERFGYPLYINIPFTFAPCNHRFAGANRWPMVTGIQPDGWTFRGEDNPVGSYRRAFDLPADWAGDKIVLQFDGVEPFFYLWVNGKYVGFSKDSRNPAAFDVTDLVKPGRNVIALEVYRYADASYLEDQDMWTLSGIIRPVALWRLPKTHLRDVRITTRPVAPGVYDGDWQVRVDAELSGPDATRELTVRLFDGDRVLQTHRFTGGKTAFVVPSPRLWSAETPNLYTLVLSHDGEASGFQLGFREVEIREAADPRDRTFLFNGKPIKLKGVNRHEVTPEYGHFVPDAELERDIRAIKLGNFNHIRNSHYPEPGYFYYLCNVYGIYVMDEANIESHGCGYGKESLSHVKSWEPAHLERVRAMVERVKNEPCVVIWSLANEAGPGDNFRTCYEWVKANDPTRPVNNERNNDLADMGARQYPSVSWVAQTAAGEQKVKYPYHINEYAHNLGNGCGNLKDYQELIESSTRIMGGALWDWRNQNLYRIDEKGRKVAAFGGEFGECPSEGMGICDGVVNADGTPEPSYFEARHVFQPFEAKLAKDGSSIVVACKHYFRGGSGYECRWTALRDGKPVQEGTWDISALGPQATASYPVPADAASVRVRVLLKADEGFWKKGDVVAEDQIDLVLGDGLATFLPASGKIALVEGDGVSTLAVGDWSYGFSQKTGQLVSMRRAGKEMLVRPIELDVFRCPVGGDQSVGGNGIFPIWTKNGLRDMRPVSGFVRGEASKVTTETVYRGACSESVWGVAGVHGCVGCRPKVVCTGDLSATATTYRVTCEWTPDASGGLRARCTFRQEGTPVEPARVGLRVSFLVPEREVSWFGRGPWDNYPDRKSASFVARWSQSMSTFCAAYDRNTDTGARESVREVTLAENGLTVRAVGKPFSMVVNPWTPTEQMLAVHPQEYPTATKTELGLYARVRGLGSNNCGPRPLPRDTIHPADVDTLEFVLGAYPSKR